MPSTGFPSGSLMASVVMSIVGGGLHPRWLSALSPSGAPSRGEGCSAWKPASDEVRPGELDSRRTVLSPSGGNSP
jgi:hypothetical protein